MSYRNLRTTGISSFWKLVFYDNESQTATIQDAAGEELPSVVGFWFAWYAFYPETQVFKNKQ
ncbi:MAG: hypothetical protein VX429_00795 [Nitrospinota bacterium]|nr:hypothetical protein [Nitrospinota bacterium]